jgi:hypothetical protein
MSAVRIFLFNIFVTTLHLEAVSSIRNLRTHHAVVTRDPHNMEGCSHGELFRVGKNICFQVIRTVTLQATDINQEEEFIINSVFNKVIFVF